jgi:hypothetical protein
MIRFAVPTLFTLSLAACGDDGQTTSSDATTSASSDPTGDPTSGSSGPPTSSTTADSTSGVSATDTATTTATTTDAPTTAGPTADTTAGTSDATDTDATDTDATDTDATDTDATTGDSGDDPFACELEDVPDTQQFTFVQQFATGMPSPLTQASFYNSYADEIMLMTFVGDARRFATDGTPLGPPFKVPPEATPALDGATYDPKLSRALLITQGCRLVETDPVTLSVYSVKQLGFGMQVCAGIAIGVDDNLYIASEGTQEIVVLDRAAEVEIRRIQDLPADGIDGPDGVALIAGSENFIVIGTNNGGDVGIIDPLGNFIVPGADIGPGSAFDGAPPMLPDAVLTLCKTGHAWLCDANDGTCDDYAPSDGDKDACGCIEQPPPCQEASTPDITSFEAVGSFATGLPMPLLQASFYNLGDQEVVIMTYFGKARRFDINGQPLGDVFDVPPEALPKLDGATYDPNLDRGLLLNQDCDLVEVDPQTFAVIETHTIGFGALTCAGIAVGLDGNLYIASEGTDEILVVSRDTTQEIDRFDTVGIAGPDGIALISGSDNFIVLGTDNTPSPVGIFDPSGGVVVPAAPVGDGMPPLSDGLGESIDAALSICGNSHVWVCDAGKDLCYDYAPTSGDLNTCGCILPG